jgi:hypothetical protein
MSICSKVPLPRAELTRRAHHTAPGRPLTRECLLQTTRLHDDVIDRSIDVRVLRLRRKLETGPQRATRHLDQARIWLCVRFAGGAAPECDLGGGMARNFSCVFQP